MTPNVKAVQKTLLHIHSKKGPFAFEAKEQVKNAEFTRHLLFRSGLVYRFRSWCLFIKGLYKSSQANSKKISFCWFHFPQWNDLGHEKSPLSWWNHYFLLQRKIKVEILPYVFNHSVDTGLLATFPRYGCMCRFAFSHMSTWGVVLPTVGRTLSIYPLCWSKAKILINKI